jgi:hypothetical protein
VRNGIKQKRRIDLPSLNITTGAAIPHLLARGEHMNNILSRKRVASGLDTNGFSERVSTPSHMHNCAVVFVSCARAYPSRNFSGELMRTCAGEPTAPATASIA